jgi:hypothetical protein
MTASLTSLMVYLSLLMLGDGAGAIIAESGGGDKSVEKWYTFYAPQRRIAGRGLKSTMVHAPESI